MKRNKLVCSILEVLLWTTVCFIAFMCLLWAHDARGQSVVRNGKMFIQQSNKIEKDSATLTGYFYIDTKGVKYPIYMSSKGKCFIWRTSSKTGKQYKQYLPEITKQLIPELITCGNQDK